MNYCVQKILPFWADFLTQKSAIKEVILEANNSKI